MGSHTIHSFFEDILATYGAYGLKLCVNRNECHSTIGTNGLRCSSVLFNEHLERFLLEMYNLMTFFNCCIFLYDKQPCTQVK